MKKYFEFDKLGTNYRHEIIGGLTTFLAMAYILIVNPLMLSLDGITGIPDEMRMDKGAVFRCNSTCRCCRIIYSWELSQDIQLDLHQEWD